MLRNIILGILSAIALTVILVVSVVAYSYSSWRSERLAEIASASQIVETAVGPVEYVLKGESGPIRLYLHGSPGGYDTAPEPGEDHRLLIPSRPGYLSTSIEAGRTPEEQATTFAALLDALDIDEPVQVMGTSGGGPSAIAFAALYPEKTSHLLLVAPVSRPIGISALPGFMQGDFFPWVIFSTLGAILGAGDAIGSDSNNPDSHEMTPADTISLLAAIWPMSQRQVGYHNDLEQFAELSLQADRITAPTLIMHGTADTSVPFTDSELLAEQIPNTTLYAIEGGVHMIPFTHANELKSTVARFLDEN